MKRGVRAIESNMGGRARGEPAATGLSDPHAQRESARDRVCSRRPGGHLPQAVIRIRVHPRP
jgi:hypothetical protein